MSGYERSSMSRDDVPEELEQPYPLARRFYLRLLPVIVVAMIAVVAAIGIAAKSASERAYLDHATRIAGNIGEDVAKKTPQAWQRLMQGAELTEPELQQLVAAFAAEEKEYRLAGLKVYDLTGRTLYATETDSIGDVEGNRVLRGVIDSGTPGIVRHAEADGTETFELYVPYGVDNGPRAVFELYEPIAGGALQRSVEQVLWPVVGLLSLMLAVGLLSLMPVISAAQVAISRRTDAIVSMRRRLERLVSKRAVSATRAGASSDAPVNVRQELTLLYADAREFTTFCERAEPEQVVAVLNRLIAMQVEEVERHGGDVDKIIGDGMLCRFEGDRREERAIAAAQALQRRIQSTDVPLRVGVGVYSGPVVLGFLGAADRLDFTVIGDSVNVAARLCAAAAAGQVVADEVTLATVSFGSGFLAAEAIALKGRLGSVSVRRWTVADDEAASVNAA